MPNRLCVLKTNTWFCQDPRRCKEYTQRVLLTLFPWVPVRRCCCVLVSRGVFAPRSTLEQLKRWLQPDKVAVSTEEVQLLLPPEPPGRGPEEEPPAAEQ